MSRLARDSSGQRPDAVQDSWRRFLEIYEPLRPDLYRYCRYLTRSPWDAEDLAQDAMGRAFVTLGQMGSAPPQPRAWLFRVASNQWMDQVRHRQNTASVGQVEDASAPPVVVEPRASREAAGTLLVRLSPQERAAVVLKDVFDLSLDEIAETLSTTVGAVKTALHRGRARLVDAEPTASRVPRLGALDAFCEAFNARDLDRLTSLLLDSAIVEVVGVTTQYGRKAARDTVLPGMLFGSARIAAADEQGGIDPRFVQGALPTSPRAEVRWHRGEWLLLLWYAHEDGDAIRAVNRIEIADGQICRLRNYFFNPDCLLEICRELGVPFRSNGYLSSC